jgi:hypothetical protein
MNFESLTIQSVKSISQRCLLWYWNDLAKSRPFPAFSDFCLDERMHDPHALVICDVGREADCNRFRLRYQGVRLEEALQAHSVGKTMEQVTPQAVRQYALDTASECVASGCAVFGVLATLDKNGHRIDCETLLLPFGRGEKVDQIMVSLHLISLTGDFEWRTILNNYRIVSTVELAGRIPAGLTRPVIATPRGRN